MINHFRTQEVRPRNPYLKAFDYFTRKDDYLELERFKWRTDTRRDLCALFSFAVPCQAAVDHIRRVTRRIVEIGAGGGYWAWFLSQGGLDVVAYDIAFGAANHYGFCHLWYPVLPGDYTKVVEHPDRALLLCWPPYREDVGIRTLRLYQGDIVIFVGEYKCGCCAEDEFFELLEQRFDEIDYVEIPHWGLVHDALWIFRRKC